MKLNDPFGRLESRHQVGYESMRDSLRRGGINTPQAAFKVIKKSKNRAVKYYIIGIALLLLVFLLLPKATPLVFGLVVFFVVWVASSTFNGQRYVQRYIDEDLK